MNAQSIVIHPLHRPGAPGIDPAPASTAAARAASPEHSLTPSQSHTNAQEGGE